MARQMGDTVSYIDTRSGTKFTLPWSGSDPYGVTAGIYKEDTSAPSQARSSFGDYLASTFQANASTPSSDFYTPQAAAAVASRTAGQTRIGGTDAAPLYAPAGSPATANAATFGKNQGASPSVTTASYNPGSTTSPSTASSSSPAQTNFVNYVRTLTPTQQSSISHLLGEIGSGYAPNANDVKNLTYALGPNWQQSVPAIGGSSSGGSSSGGSAGSPPTPPVQTGRDIYNSLYSSSGIQADQAKVDAVNTQIAQVETQISQIESEVNAEVSGSTATASEVAAMKAARAAPLNAELTGLSTQEQADQSALTGARQNFQDLLGQYAFQTPAEKEAATLAQYGAEKDLALASTAPTYHAPTAHAPGGTYGPVKDPVTGKVTFKFTQTSPADGTPASDLTRSQQQEKAINTDISSGMSLTDLFTKYPQVSRTTLTSDYNAANAGDFDIKDAVKQFAGFLNPKRGSDGRISPSDYLTAANSWLAQGGQMKDFVNNFKSYKNPNNLNYFDDKKTFNLGNPNTW